VTSSAAPRRRSFSTLLATALLAVAALLVLPASPAFAHDELVSTDPPADAVLDALPTQITFTYSADILTEEGTAVVEVTDADGASLTAGSPVVSGTDVTQALTGAASGAVTVKWRVVSSDGHPIDGTFAFTVNAATPTPTATPTASPASSAPATSAPATASPDATTPASDTASAASPLPWILLVVALVIVAAALVWLFVSRGRRNSSGGGSAGTTGR